MKVYIASPYTNEAPEQVEKNVYRSMVVADLLIDEGYIPVMPLLSHFYDKIFPRSYDFWMEYCFALLKDCDACLRLKGESEGADREVAFCYDNDIPVYETIGSLIIHGKM